MERFSDFADEPPTLEGTKVKLQDIVNQPIIVQTYRLFKSKVSNGDCLQLQILVNNENKIIFTSSCVLIKQITKYQNHLPFETTIKRISKYYSFT